MYEKLNNPFFILAPMDDVTDSVFRQVVAGCSAPDLFVTEFVNADGLQSPGRAKLIKKLKFSATEQPLIAQIWGKEPDNFYQTANQLADGTFAKEFSLDGINFAGVDLNMGCPQKTEVSNGTCAALINNRPLAKEIISATKDGLGGKLPLSVKTRLGYDDFDLSWPEFLLEQGLNMLTIHGRTKKQKSMAQANWELIGKVREVRDRVAPSTLIVGNGDVMSRAQGERLAKKYSLDGIMIGRGALQDPFVFSEASPWESYTKQQRIDLYKQQVSLFKVTWTKSERPIHTLNKFCKIYISGFDGAKELRDKLMHAKSADELLDSLNRI